MSLESSTPQEDCGRDAQSDDHAQYRLRYYFGDLLLFSEWRDDGTHVENLAEQLRRSSTFHDIEVEAKAVMPRFAAPGEAARGPSEAQLLGHREDQ
jgi:hypothetical protein